MRILTEDELRNLEVLTGIYELFKDKPITSTVGYIGISSTSTATGTSNITEADLLRTLREEVLMRMITLTTINEDCGCEDELNDAFPEDNEDDTEYLTTSEMMEYLKINSNSKASCTSGDGWEEDEYVYYDKATYSFKSEDGQDFTLELENYYDDTDNWILL